MTCAIYVCMSCSPNLCLVGMGGSAGVAKDDESYVKHLLSNYFITIYDHINFK